MILGDAGLRQRQTKAVNPHYPIPPWLTKDATRDRSNRLLEGAMSHPPARMSDLVNRLGEPGNTRP